MRIFAFLLTLFAVVIFSFSNKGVANDNTTFLKSESQFQKSLIEPFKGVCAPRHTAPNDYVCVIIEGIKNCDKDSDCVIQ